MIAEESVKPFLIVVNPEIEVCGVNSTAETIATIESEVVSCRTTLSAVSKWKNAFFAPFA